MHPTPRPAHHPLLRGQRLTTPPYGTDGTGASARPDRGWAA
ncbi:hypothetical protein [Streptomyces sp. NPDC014733]